MKKQILIALLLGIMPFSAMAAYQYETKGNQGWLTFDSETTVAFDLVRSGKDKDHNNFIDAAKGSWISAGTIWIPGQPVLSTKVSPQPLPRMTVLVCM